MKFGTIVQFKKDYPVNDLITIKAGHRMAVANYAHKYFVQLMNYDGPGLSDFITIKFSPCNRNSVLGELFEVVGSMIPIIHESVALEQIEAPKRVADWEGCKVTNVRELRNGRMVIPVGSLLTINKATTRKSLSAEPCPHCGVKKIIGIKDTAKDFKREFRFVRG